MVQPAFPAAVPKAEELESGVVALTRFLKRRGSPNAVVPGTKSTLLACAASFSNEAAVRLLLQHPSIDLTVGYPALNEAVYANSKECIRALLAHPSIRVNGCGFFPPSVDPYNTAPSEAPAIDRSGRIERSLHPLHVAVIFSRTSAVEVLLESPSITVDPPSPYGTPFFIAAARGHGPILQLLAGRLDTAVNRLHNQRSPLRALCERPARVLVDPLPHDSAVDYRDLQDRRFSSANDDPTTELRVEDADGDGVEGGEHASNALASGVRSRSTSQAKSSSFGPPSKVFDWLYVGSEINVRSPECLDSFGIKRVLCVSPQPREKEGLVVKHVPMPDDPTTGGCVEDGEGGADVGVLSGQIVPFLDEAKEAYGKGEGAVLVHCVSGVNRSVVAVLMYLILAQCMSLAEAWGVVKKARECALPHEGYLDQLSQLEMDCLGEDTRAEMSDYTPLRDLLAGGKVGPETASGGEGNGGDGGGAAEARNSAPAVRRPPPSVVDLVKIMLQRSDVDINLSDPLGTAIGVRDFESVKVIASDPRSNYIMRVVGGRTTSRFDALRAAAIASARKRHPNYVPPPLPIVLETGLGTEASVLRGRVPVCRKPSADVVVTDSSAPTRTGSAATTRPSTRKGVSSTAAMVHGLATLQADALTAAAPLGSAADAGGPADGGANVSSPSPEEDPHEGGVGGQMVMFLDGLLRKAMESVSARHNEMRADVIRSRTPCSPHRRTPEEFQGMVERLYPDPVAAANRKDELYRRHYPTRENRVLTREEEDACLKRLDEDLERRIDAQDARVAAAADADLRLDSVQRLPQAVLDGVVERLHHSQPMNALAKA